MVQASSCLMRKRFHGLMRTMRLKNKVRPIKKESTGFACLSEMGAMMDCWRGNAFEDPPCLKQIEKFIECSAKVHASPEAHMSKGSYKHSSTEVKDRLHAFAMPQ